MAYTTGSRLTQANPAEDAYNLIAAAFTAHAAYEFVETYVVSTTTHHVWKCKGTLNSAGVDYFIIFSRATAAGTLLLSAALAEQYNSTTHAYSKAAPNPGTGSVTPQADYTYTAAATVLSATNVSELTIFRPQVSMSTSAYDYWLVVTNDGFYFGTRVGTTASGFLISTYDKLINPPTADVFPVVVMSATAGDSSSTMSGACTRHPLVTTSQARLWGVRALFQTASNSSIWTSPVTLVGPAVGNPGSLFQEARPMAARVALVVWAAITTYSPSAVGDVRGLYRNLLASQVTASVVIGDTITVGTDVYVFMGNANAGYGTWFNTSAV